MPHSDYIVVGAGSAGCVLANRLSEDGRSNVLLLEAGPEDRYFWIHLPIGYAKTMFHPVYNWGYYTDPDPNMKGRKLYWPRGRCIAHRPKPPSGGGTIAQGSITRPCRRASAIWRSTAASRMPCARSERWVCTR